MADTEEPLNNNNDDDEGRRRREEAMEQMLLQQEQEIEQDDDPNNNGVPLGEDAAAAPQVLIPQAPPPQQQQASSKERPLSYIQASFLAAGATLYYAFRTRQQYYLALVYLSSSKWAVVVLANFVLAVALQVFDYCTHIFLNGMRLHEAEGLQDFFRWNVTETCIALTMFRSELSVATSLEFLGLVWIKCIHQVAILRESHVRMTDDAIVEHRGWPAIPFAHIKLLSLLILLQLVDLWVVQHTCSDLLTNGPSVSILFAFEAAILLVSTWSHLLLWHLHMLDGLLHFGHDRHYRYFSKWIHIWKEYKATLTFAVELQAQGVQFLFYLTFFAIVLTYYGMPINLFREVYMSFAALKGRLFAFLKFRRLMASMNRFADVTDEQLDEAGRICIICRDEMTVQDCKKLPICNHLFHKSCLREWLVQQQSCPTCRSDIAAMEAQEAARNAAAAAAAQREGHQGEGGAGVPGEEQPQNEQGREEHPAAGPRVAASQAADISTNESRQTDRKVKFPKQAEADLGFPALYQVVKEDGANVWESPSKDSGSVIRTVPLGVLVLGQEQRQRPDATCMLKVPDGWVDQDTVKRVHTLRKSRATH